MGDVANSKRLASGDATAGGEAYGYPLGEPGDIPQWKIDSKQLEGGKFSHEVLKMHDHTKLDGPTILENLRPLFGRFFWKLTLHLIRNG